MTSKADADYAERLRSFERWFQSPLGRSLLEDQRRCVDYAVAGLSGARQLQVGISHRLPLATGSDFSQQIISTPDWAHGLGDGVAVCEADELPFPGDCMDLVVLHHTVDFSRDPHQVLREAARILRGGGQILLIGFNPISLWGVRRLLSRHHYGPWGGRFLRKGRMEDWLRLLDFEIDTAGSHFLRLPVQNTGASGSQGGGAGFRGNRLLPVGAYYCILATKRVCAPIRLRPAWRKKKVIALPSAGTVGALRGYERSDRQE